MQLNDLQAWIDANKDEIEGHLKHLVEINTYTTNKNGVDEGMDEMCRIAEDMDFTPQVIHGRHRLIKGGNGTRRPRILLISHMDTVFPPDGDFRTYTPLDDGFVQGPGVGDIKGGLIMGLWAMRALRELTSGDFDVQLVVSADEEIGSPSIRDWYMGGNINADFAIGLEPGFPQGPLTADVPLGVVYQRRGYCAVNFQVHGQQSHSGTPENGLSAVEAMAHRVLKIHALSDTERGITTNVGTVTGGISANTIPEGSKALMSFRYWKLEDGEETLEKVKAILEDRYIYNEMHDVWDSAEYMVESFIPPMEPSDRNQILVDTVLEQAERLGHNVVPIARGGGSDANFISGSGVPTICGMGAPAHGIHTEEERIYLPMLFNRVNLLASTLYTLINREG